jgi:phosphoglucosamine mutase
VSILIGRDTRRSGAMLESALASGIASAGGVAVLGGVLPTPAVAEQTAVIGAAGGAVISASHNPFPDNGIKLFGADGFKLPDEDEVQIERLLDEDLGAPPQGADVGEISVAEEVRERYVESILERLPLDLAGLDLVVDCAHGATAVTAPEVLRRCGAQVTVIGADPNGVNINAGCGSTDLTALQRAVTAGSHDLGLAFDGDGDRVLAVDAAGEVVDGDQILALCALRLKDEDALAGDAVVTTTMTNLGFRRAMSDHGIEVRWTDVGDRYVLQEMRANGYVLGGEQSGHLINLTHGPTGDGLAAGLQLLGALSARRESLSEAAQVMTRSPQKLVSVTVARKDDLPAATEVWELVERFERELGDDGRVVVRASGTEPLVRVMVEAPTELLCSEWCASIAEAAENALGG